MNHDHTPESSDEDPGLPDMFDEWGDWDDLTVSPDDWVVLIGSSEFKRDDGEHFDTAAAESESVSAQADLPKSKPHEREFSGEHRRYRLRRGCEPWQR